MKGCRPLTDEEIKLVLNSLDNLRDKALFMLGIRSAFRISELLSLKVDDLYQSGKVLDAVYISRRNIKNKLEGRSVVLHREAKEAIECWINELIETCNAKPDTFLFKSRKSLNKSITRVQAWRVLGQAFTKCGLTGKLGTHSMRKTFADRVYEKLGRDLFRTKIALGHRNVNSTCSYLSFKEDEVKEAILSV